MASPKQISKTYALRPRKRLGQSFLQDRNIIRKIVTLADLRPEESVIEIGAGLGFMTSLIAAEARQVLALEIDPRLVHVLREELGKTENIRIVHTDVLAFDLSQAASDLAVDKLKVIGNIPYHISTPILFHLLNYRRYLSSAILMVQKEVAERIAARPGTKNYGIPSVFTAVYARTALAFTVPAACFYPAPKVTSAVLRLDFREQPLAFIENDGFFKDVVRMAFASRRKTLMNNLRHWDGLKCSPEALDRLCARVGLDSRLRGEALTPEQFISLSNLLFREMASGASVHRRPI